MSKRNSHAAKQAARERLRIEREQQAKRDRIRRQLIVAGSIVGVLALAGGIGYGVMQANKPGYWESAKDSPLVKPAHTSGKNGTTVVVGKADAKKTLKVYEDSRCPICAGFEQTVGPTVTKDLDQGKYKIQFIGATFIDGDDLSRGKIGSVGEGSKNALSALGAALNVSPEAFLAYKTELYSTKYHPEEQDDKFKSDAYLVKVADQVPALKGNAAFRKALEKGTYDRWALEMSKTFATNKDGVRGTPSFVMNGKMLVGSDGKNSPLTVADYTAAVGKALKS